MISGTLTASTVRQTWLRGIELGTGWSGASADAAIEQLLAFHQAKAERILGVAFCAKRIRTLPETGLVLGEDYEVAGDLVPYVLPVGSPPQYVLPLRFGPLRSLDRVRVFQGYDTSVPAVAQFETVAPTQTLPVPFQQRVYIPAAAVTTAPNTAWGWALDYTYGLHTIPLEVAEWIALGTTIALLGIAGSNKDLGAGVAAWSLDQDGIVERGEHITDTYGPYSGAIETLRLQYDLIDLKKLRMHYQ